MNSVFKLKKKFNLKIPIQVYSFMLPNGNHSTEMELSASKWVVVHIKTFLHEANTLHPTRMKVFGALTCTTP